MKLSFECDKKLVNRKSLGLIVLSEDKTIEDEFRELFNGSEATLFHSRIKSEASVTRSDLMRMKDRLTQAASLFPNNTNLDVVGYACTSGATIIGSQEVARAVSVGCRQTTTVTNPADAVISALKKLSAKNIGIVSPYVTQVSDVVRRLLASNGLNPITVGSYEQSEEAIVANISETSILKATCIIGDDPKVDAVFVSCTNLRTLNMLHTAEEKIEKPVVSSNLALAWHMMKLADLAIDTSRPERLFQLDNF